MNPTLPLWILSAATLTEPMSVPDSFANLPSLSRFSARWSVNFREVPHEIDTLGARADAEQAESVRRIEALFVAAKTAIGALRAAEADGALAEAEQLIRSHPELPQGAWLLAELHTTRAERVEGDDPILARELARRAAILEGERGQAFRDATRAGTPLALPEARELAVTGPDSRARIEWDGEASALNVASRSGEHHVRVLRGERLVWAGWVTVGDTATTVNLPVPAVTPCSADDLDGAVEAEPSPRAHPRTQCSDWAAARVRNGELELARCHAGSCGAWEHASAPPPTRNVSNEAKSPLPRWLTYAVVGAGTALVAGIVLASSGAFSSSDPTRERWVYSGFK
ncbi:MAG TPA: hypothetical protein VFQ35_00295 [Polyangiaceae bacterium]|nr:hypothetical protein [Polyangiaceae bacterium]